MYLPVVDFKPRHIFFHEPFKCTDINLSGIDVILFSVNNGHF